MKLFNDYKVYGGGSIPFLLDKNLKNKGTINLLPVYKFINHSTLPYLYSDGALLIIDDCIHILGGKTESGSRWAGTTHHYKYDGTSWTEVSTLPYSFTNGGAVLCGNEIHIFGSTGWTTDIKDHYKYDGASWTEVGTLPTTSSSSSVYSVSKSISYNNEIHALLQGIHYKFSNNTWTLVSTPPVSGDLYLYKNKIILVSTKGIYQWDNVSSSWTNIIDNIVGSTKIVIDENDNIITLLYNSVKCSYGIYDGTNWVLEECELYDFNKAVYYKNNIHILGSRGYTDSTNGKNHQVEEVNIKLILDKK